MRSTLASLALLGSALFFSACASETSTSLRLAQRGAPMTCSQDTDCAARMRMPRARRCSNGQPQTPSACCRMGYCGVCWSECGR